MVEVLDLWQRHLQQEPLHHQLLQILTQACQGEKLDLLTLSSKMNILQQNRPKMTLTLQRDASLLGVENSLTMACPTPLWCQTRSLYAQHQPPNLTFTNFFILFFFFY